MSTATDILNTTHHDDHHHGPARAKALVTTNHKDIGTLYLWFYY